MTGTAPADMGDGTPTPARMSRWTWFVGVCGLVSLIGGALFLRPAYPAYQYLSGAPATATIAHCVSRNGETCYGSWGVGDATKAGAIHGLYDSRDRTAGAQVRVHVRGAEAFTSSYGRLAIQATAGGVLALVIGAALLWSARRKYRTGRWPLSRRVA